MDGYSSRGDRSRDTSECNSIEFSADDDNSQGNNDRSALDKFFTLENGPNSYRNKGKYEEKGEQRYDMRFYEHRPTPSFVGRVRRNSESASAYSSAYSGYHSSGAASDGDYESPTLASHQTNPQTLPSRHHEGPRKYRAERDDSSREGTPTPFNSSRAEYHLSWHRLGDISEYTGDQYSPRYEDLSHTKKSNIDVRFPLHCNPSYPCSSTMSEAAKSDIATVCSGSVLDDTDLVSVLSGDMNASAVDGSNFKLTAGTFGRSALGSNSGLSSTVGSGVGGIASSSLHNGLSSRQNELLTVEFALERHGSPATISSHLNLHDNHLTSFSGNHSLTSRSDGGSADAFGGISSTNDMGPPLSRELMGFRYKSGPGSANSVASSKGALSDGFSLYTPDDTAYAVAEMDFHSLQNAGPLSALEGSESNYADNQSQTSMEQKMQAMGLQMKEGSEGSNIFIDSSHGKIHRADFERTPGRLDFNKRGSGRSASEQKLDRPNIPNGRARAGAHRRSRSRSWSRSRSRSPVSGHSPWSARERSKSPERRLHQACNRSNRYRYHVQSSRDWERSRLHSSASCSNSIYYPHQRTSFRLPVENNERFLHASNDTHRRRNVEYPSR